MASDSIGRGISLFGDESGDGLCKLVRASDALLR